MVIISLKGMKGKNKNIDSIKPIECLLFERNRNHSLQIILWNRISLSTTLEFMKKRIDDSL